MTILKGITMAFSSLRRQHLPPPGNRPFAVEAWAFVNTTVALLEATFCMWLASRGQTPLAVGYILAMTVAAAMIAKAVSRGAYPASSELDLPTRRAAGLLVLAPPVTCALGVAAWYIVLKGRG